MEKAVAPNEEVAPTSCTSRDKTRSTPFHQYVVSATLYGKSELSKDSSSYKKELYWTGTNGMDEPPAHK
jgi:hypothetical protein